MTHLRSALLALHYQNENCHPDGKIKVGIAADAPWREQRMHNARRLFAGMRKAGVPIVHVRLAVNPDYLDVVANTPIIREWVARGAWREGTWGVEFLEGLEPLDGELVLTHTRNSVFHGCPVPDALVALRAAHLYFAGVSTAYVVEGSVRHATDIGYPCTVVADACSTATEEQHRKALNAMRLLAEVATVDEVLAMCLVEPANP
ncbi:MAG: cysteine hydrolase [Gammaproteobacteria bacterium]